MKFLAQTKDNEIVHDFTFTLREAIRYRSWYFDSKEDEIIYTNKEKPTFVDDACPVGSVEFVSYYLNKYYNKTPKPVNIPECLYHFADRVVWIGNENDYKNPCFVKNHDTIKKFSAVIEDDYLFPLDKGTYQYSELIGIHSEWRCFVYNNKLVGLQNYSGEFILFPDIDRIMNMIKTFKSEAPVAYTLDIGVNNSSTFVIEVHDFFACGLYGFADLNLLPLMFYRWFKEFIK